MHQLKKKSAFEYYIFCASEHKRVKERKCTSCLNWPVCYSLCASGKNVQFTHLSELLPNATSAELRNLKKNAFECYIFCASEHKRVKERKCTSYLNCPECYSLNVQFNQLSRLLSNATSSVLRNIKE